MRGEPGERGHQPAGAALDRPVVLIGDGAPVRDQDEGALIAHPPLGADNGRSPSLTLISLVSPPRWTSTVTSWPGWNWATTADRSLASSIVLPSTLVMMSPPWA